jgi:membrane fusion protein, multidrug efflux system
MSKRGLAILGIVAVATTSAAYVTQDRWLPLVTGVENPLTQSPQAQRAPAGQRGPGQGRGQQGQRPIPVETANALRSDVPLRLDALGTVQPMASVAIKSRLETEIVGVHFEDGATVKSGDLLFTLDSRQIDAQILQAEGVLARDRAQLEGVERDIKRFAELVARNAGTRVSLENAETQADMLRGTIKAAESALRNLQVQRSYTRIYAPITGRMSAATVKVGNFVRPADTAALATIVQIKPVYVAFGVPQRSLPDVRRAIAEGTGRVEALAQGEAEPAVGRIAMIDNTVDQSTGMLIVRAQMDNADETLWPGSLVRVSLVLRVEPAVTVPSAAIQSGQTGTFVFVVRDGAASVQQVTVARTIDGRSVIADGLKGGEVVVTDGQLLLAEGTRVAPRQRRAGS